MIVSPYLSCMIKWDSKSSISQDFMYKSSLKPYLGSSLLLNLKDQDPHEKKYWQTEVHYKNLCESSYCTLLVLASILKCFHTRILWKDFAKIHYFPYKVWVHFSPKSKKNKNKTKQKKPHHDLLLKRVSFHVFVRTTAWRLCWVFINSCLPDNCVVLIWYE